MKANRRIQTAFIDYESYIKSKEWQAVRQRYFQSKMPQKCMACNLQKQKGFHIHHATYKRLGMEYLSDLRLLCPECHQGVHDLQKKTGLKLLSATNRFIRETRKKHGLNPNVYSDNSKPRIAKPTKLKIGAVGEQCQTQTNKNRRCKILLDKHGKCHMHNRAASQ